MIKKILTILLLSCFLIAGVVSASFYNNVTTLTVNTTTGSLVSYQVKFILSNSSGVSGRYGTDNIIYTNGTTRPDWLDINFTTSGGTPLPYWKEDGSYSEKNVSVWGRIPSIVSGNTSQVLWYYGNSSETTEKSSIYNTFIFGDDFNTVGSINLTQWTLTNRTGFVTGNSNGYLNVTGANSGQNNRASLQGKINITTNATVEALLKPMVVGSKGKAGVSWRDFATSPVSNVAGFGFIGTNWDGYNDYGLYYTSWAYGSEKIATDLTVTMPYRYIVKMSDNTTGTTIKSVNYSAEYSDTSNQVKSKNLNPELDFEYDTGTTSTLTDWIFVRNYTTTEPTTSLYSTTSRTTFPPTASFTASNTSGIYPPSLPVRFTDTSTNTPTSWEWNFTNTTGNNTAVTFATTQSPLWSFDIGNYSISLNATNADGSGTSAQVTWINVSAPTTLSLAEFTGSPLSGNPPLSVTFTDADGTGETAWFWIFGDGNTTSNTLQNPVHLYTVSGTYTVNHSATNAVGTNWTNKTGYITVTNASGFTPQDVWQTQLLLQTWHITDSDTGLPIPVVNLQDTAMATYTTTNGTGYLTETFGASSVVFTATGYSPKSVSYFFDSEATHDVQLTPAATTPSQNTWYTPWQVRIRILDYYGMPLSNINVSANYVASTLPSTDTSWLVTAYGISSAVATDMVNSAKAMEGVTDDNGGLSFTMFKSIQYRLTITNSTLSVASTKTLYPSDQEYVIYVRTAGQTVANNTLAMRNGTLPWYSVNSTHINLNMTYVDTSLCTSQLVFRVWFRDNGTEVHNTTWSGFGAGYVYDNHTVPKAPIGTEYLWGYNATTVC